MGFVELADVVQPDPACRHKVLECFADQKHIVQHGTIQSLDATNRLLPVLLHSHLVLGEPFQEAVAGAAVDCVLVDISIADDVAGERDPALAVDPGAEIAGVE